jgi:hypothetical protein
MKTPFKVVLTIVGIAMASILLNQTATAENQSAIQSMVFSPDGSELIVNTNTAINLYDANFQLRATLPHDDPNMPRRAYGWSPDGTKLKVNANEIYNASTLQLLQTLNMGSQGLGGWNSDGTVMWARDPESPGLVFIDPATDQITKHISTGNLQLEWYSLSPDDNYFVSSIGKDLAIIGVVQSQVVAEYQLTGFIQGAIWSPNSQFIAVSLLVNTSTAPPSYAIDMVDIATGSVIRQIDGLVAVPREMFFSPDGNQITVQVGTNIIQTWDLQTGQLVDEHVLGTGIRAIARSPYGGRLIMAFDNSKPLTLPVPPNDNSSALLSSYLSGSIQMIVPAPSMEKLADTLAFCNLDSTTYSNLESLISEQQYQTFVNTVSSLGANQINTGCKADVLTIANTLIKLEEIVGTVTFTPTGTLTPTTSTPTNTPTATAGAFPTTNVLDNFNRANGALGSNWGGNVNNYSISNNQLHPGQDWVYWTPNAFGASQEAYITLANIDQSSAEIDLLLKIQSSGGTIEVLYYPPGGYVQVWTYTPGADWQQYGSNIPVTFANGDQFGARALENGSVEVYKNGSLVGTADVSAWQFAQNGGSIGLWTVNAGTTLLDDFGGGTTGSEPVPTNTPGPTPTPTLSPTPTATPANTTSITSQPAQGSDDANEDGSALTTNSTTLWFGNGASTSKSYLGLRFNNVTVPRGATITSAKLQVYSSQSQWIYVDVQFAAEASNNAATFSTSSKPSQRSLTTARVNHSSDGSWSANTWYDLDDISSVIQEVTNRTGWQSGNSLVIILKGTGGSYGRKFIASYDGDPTYAPKLVITYQNP